MKESPLLYYVYVGFPVYFWTEVFREWKFINGVLKATFSTSSNSGIYDWGKIFLRIAFYFASLEILVTLFPAGIS